MRNGSWNDLGNRLSCPFNDLFNWFTPEMRSAAYNINRRLFPFLLFFQALSFPANAVVTLPKVFSDHMVLQQSSSVRIWGWAEAEESIQIKCSWLTEPAQTVADADGNWLVTVETPAAADAMGSQTVSVMGTNTIELNDVLIGEVWVLSGQSNMSIPLTGWSDAPIEGSAEAIATASHPNLRLMVVGEYSASEAQKDIHTFWDAQLRQWSVCTPSSVRYFSALGYFFGKQLLEQLEETPVGLLQCAWAGSSCEAWVSPSDLEMVANYRGKGPWVPGSTRDNWTASGVWNGMLSPIIPFTMRGVLWYQGESNMGRAEELAQLFPQMIEGWRREWGQGDFPFCFAQLAPWSEYWPGQEPELWEAQASALFLPNTGMVSTLDLVDADELDNIHPKRKAPIGERMARWAVANVYGQTDLIASGPIYQSIQIVDGKIIVSFSNVENGLVAKNDSLSWFEIAGEDEVFFPAKAQIVGSQVVLQSDSVPLPTQARYAWSKTASGDLFNSESLPAPSFRTQPADYLVSHNGNPIVQDGWDQSFYVRQGHLMDPSGVEVKPYGINMPVSRFDEPTGPMAVALIPTVQSISGSNIIRISWNTFAKGTIAASAQRLDEVIACCLENEMIPLVRFTDLTGNSDAQMVRDLVSTWMTSEYLAVFQKYQQKMLLEVNAGWSQPISTAWHDVYFDLITILRNYNGGIQCPLVVEAADIGTDLSSIETYGSGLLSHDPFGSVIFSCRLKADDNAAIMASTLERIAGLKALKTPLLVSEVKVFSTEWNENVAVETQRQLGQLQKLGVGYIGWTWCGDSVNRNTNLTSEVDWATLTPWGSILVSGERGIQHLANPAPSLVPVEVETDTTVEP